MGLFSDLFGGKRRREVRERREQEQRDADRIAAGARRKDERQWRNRGGYAEGGVIPRQRPDSRRREEEDEDHVGHYLPPIMDSDIYSTPPSNPDPEPRHYGGGSDYSSGSDSSSSGGSYGGGSDYSSGSDSSSGGGSDF